MSNNTKNICAKIKKLRKEYFCFKQIKDFSVVLGINEKNLQRYEKGRRPSDELIIKICKLTKEYGERREIRPAWVVFDEKPIYVDQLITNDENFSIYEKRFKKEERFYIERLVDILRSGDESRKLAIMQNINQFHKDMIEIKKAPAKELPGKPIKKTSGKAEAIK